MSNQPPFMDYLVIILLGAGVAALGAEELRTEHNIGSWNTEAEGDYEEGGVLLRDSQEDFSSRFASGSTVEELQPQSEEERKARFSWSDSDSVEDGDEDSGQRGFVGKLTDSLFGSSPDEEE